ncbi:MAG: sulfite exporter TauE/SafE family protein [Dysgonamonadaceae bacterium]|jgi:high-affinity nickel permease|nr:sulfite exporter TauE/SafE family protein [Dysgonamonadaceae bacterium]
MGQLPLLILLFYALYEGLLHAFEADHVLAVTNIVSQRNKIFPSIKDGIFWGLGHTSTIFLIGIIMILFKVNIPENSFSYFEAAVGLMLILVASYRLYIFFRDEKIIIHKHRHEHAGTNKHLHAHVHLKGKNLHKTSYGIGAVHGLAGSGTLVVLIMTQINSVTNSLLFLVIFGLGSIIGMSLVAGIFSIPFSKKLINSKKLKITLVVISSVLCFGYGCYVIHSNLN